MGNCINRPSSSVTVTITRDDTNTNSKALAIVQNCSCDDRTAESSSNATLSPPSSPVKPEVEAVGSIPHEPTGTVSPHDVLQPKLPVNERDEHDASSVERQREDGQRRLRDLVVSGANAGEIDWKAIVALAEDLHKKEQQLLRSYNGQRKRRLGNKKDSENISCRHNISKRQAFFEKRRRRRELSRRKKMESVGSFSVNLHMYDHAEQEERCHRQDEEEDASTILSENDIIQSSSSEAIIVDDTSDELDVFEDDDPSSLHHDPLGSVSPSCRERRGTDRPSTPMPVLIGPASIAPPAPEGSFMAATSLFAPSKNAYDDHSECSSSSGSSSSSSDSSTSSVSPLMTIDEDAVRN